MTIFAAGYAGALSCTRLFAPRADPALFPTAAVLVGLGFAMIFRLSGSLAAEQATWILIGLVVYCLTLVLVRDSAGWTRTRTRSACSGIAAAAAADRRPGIGAARSTARGCGSQVGPLGFQPAEIGKVLIVIFLASYLNAKKELLAIATTRLGPFRLPEPRYLGAAAGRVGRLAGDPVRRERPGFVAAVLRDLRRDALGRDRARGSTWCSGADPVRRRAPALAYADLRRTSQVRVTIWLHALDREGTSSARATSSRRGCSRFGTAGIAGTGLGLGHPVLIPDAWTDFIFAAIGEELGLLGVTAVLLLYVVLVGRGLRRRWSAHGRVQQAAGGRARHGDRAADVRHRRRRDAADPAHRRDAAVRLLRRLEPRDELRPARRCCVRVSSGPPRAGAMPARLGPRTGRRPRRRRADG